MAESKIIPNSYQTPNFYADELMELLTSEEWKVLSYAIRRIFGFNTRRATISVSMFCKGFKTREGVHYRGTGLGTNAVGRAIDGLIQAGILSKVAENNPALNYGATYELQLDSNKINIAMLEERQKKRVLSNKGRIEKARFVRQNGGTTVPQNGGTTVPQKVKTHETQETHMAQSADENSMPLPVDWQIGIGAKKITQPTEEQEFNAQVDIACMAICHHGADLEPLARAFMLARKLTPAKKSVKGWASALREMKMQKVTPEIITLAVQELAERNYTIADPYSIVKTAISKANPVKSQEPLPDYMQNYFGS